MTRTQTGPTSLAGWPIGLPAVLVATGSSTATRTRLAQLGLRPGAQVTALLRTPGRGVVLACGDLRVALDRQSAAQIEVCAVDGDDLRSRW